jgi:hypothetical protein
LLRLRVVVAALALAALASCSPHGPGSSATPSPLPIATGDYPMQGHAPDFSWISGRIERDLSCTYLLFGDRRRTPWGGRVVLAASADQSLALRSGDAVVVKGELTRLAYGSCGAPSYVVDSIEEH